MDASFRGTVLETLSHSTSVRKCHQRILRKVVLKQEIVKIVHEYAVVGENKVLPPEDFEIFSILKFVKKCGAW